jgi:hypothetical protein
VVETNVHYPTDSSLLGDGARVLTRTMKKVEKATGGLKKRIRNRMRSVNKKVIAIALAGRLKGPEGEERRVQRYRELVSLTRKIVYQAEGVLEEMQHLARHRQAATETIPGDLGSYDRTCATGGAANQGASVSRGYQVCA